ncbi:YuzF family protein [Clostridiaceae bacterium 35-E11]
MNYQLYPVPIMQDRRPIQYATLIDPYVVETLRTIIGQSVVIETVRGSLQGILADVMPDHIVVKSYDRDTVFYVRMQQIVHVMPN